MSEVMGHEIGWDDPVEQDGQDFIILPAGDYNFEVIDFERGRHGGSEKLPPCNKAIITIRCQGPEGISTVKHNLFLHTITEGMISAFLVSIGQKKHGERVVPRWNQVVGAKGRCKLGVRKWTNNEGEEKTFNEVKKFYEPEVIQASFTPGQF